MRCIPNLVIMTPSNENECYQMLFTAYMSDKPCAVRYPRGVGIGAVIDDTMRELPIGKGAVVKNGVKIVLLAFGSMLANALDVANEIDATVCDMRFVKPLDLELLHAMAVSHDYIVTLEENVIMGGAGSACSEALQEMNMLKHVLHIGLPDYFIEHGDPKILLRQCGLDKNGIISKIKIKGWI